MELYRDIVVLGVQQQATIRPGHAHDTAWQGHDICHDMALGAATHAHGLGAGCVAIQPTTCPARPATRPPMLATRPRGGHDKAGPGLRHGQARPATRRSVRACWGWVFTWCT